MDEAEHGVRQAMNAYLRDFSRLDWKAIASHYCEPCVLVTNQFMAVLPTHAELASRMVPLLDGLRARGYVKSEWATMFTRTLGERIALASAVAVRYGGDERELERIGATYTLYRTDDGWRILMLVGHAPETAIPPR